MPTLTDSHSLPGISCDIVYPWPYLPGNQDIRGNFYLCLLCQYLCWSSRWIHVPAALSFLCPYDSCAAGWELFLVVMLVLFDLTWWFHQLLQFYLWMINTAVEVNKYYLFTSILQLFIYFKRQQNGKSPQNQYSCSFFYSTSALVDGQPCNTYSDCMLTYSSSIV